MKRKLISVLLPAVLFISVLSGCIQEGVVKEDVQIETVENDKTEYSETDEEKDSAIESHVLSDEVRDFVTEEAKTLLNPSDYYKDYMKRTFTQIVLTDGQSRVQEAMSENKDDVITIKKGGYYLVSGSLSDGQLRIDVDKTEKVYLFLDNVSITCKDASPLYVINGDKVILSLLSGTVNTFTDESTGEAEDGDLLSACIFSKEDLTINGSGTLVVNANARDGITSKDSLKLVSGNVIVNAANDGICANDEIILMDASVSVTAGDSDGEMKVNTHGGANNNFWGIAPEEQTKNKDSKKGLKSDGEIKLLAGDLQIQSEDDAVHAGKLVRIGYTEMNISTVDDGIHSDEEIVVSNGKISIEKSYEGIEAPTITIDGGEIYVTAIDDGFSASGKDGKGALITFNGGHTIVDAQGDGLDSNDTIIVNGGEVVVIGPSENFDGYFDVERALLVNGGTLLGIGSSGMLCVPSVESESLSFTATGLYGEEGALVEIRNKSDETVFEMTALRRFSALTFSDESMEEGDEYRIVINGELVKTVAASKDSFDPNGWMRPDGLGGPGGPGGPGGDRPPEKSEGERPPEKPEGERP